MSDLTGVRCVTASLAHRASAGPLLPGIDHFALINSKNSCLVRGSDLKMPFT